MLCIADPVSAAPAKLEIFLSLPFQADLETRMPDIGPAMTARGFAFPSAVRSKISNPLLVPTRHHVASRVHNRSPLRVEQHACPVPG